MRTQRGLSNQPSEDWLTAREAAALLGVRTATIYAYASRGLLGGATRGPGKRALYPRDRVEQLRLKAAARAGHAAVAAAALRWGEPVLDSALTRISPRGPVYRGQRAVDLVETPLEQVAELLWQQRVDWSPCLPRVPTRGARPSLQVLLEVTLAHAPALRRDGSTGSRVPEEAAPFRRQRDDSPPRRALTSSARVARASASSSPAPDDAPATRRARAGQHSVDTHIESAHDEGSPPARRGPHLVAADTASAPARPHDEGSPSARRGPRLVAADTESAPARSHEEGSPSARRGPRLDTGHEHVPRAPDGVVASGSGAQALLARLACAAGRGEALAEQESSLAGRVATSLLGRRATASERALINAAMVLMADHELNASTFAARVAAGAGAHWVDCLLAALATATGPRHVAACDAAEDLWAQVRETRRLEIDEAGPLPGFEAGAYDDGDPRASRLLTLLRPQLAPGIRRRLDRFLSRVELRRKQLPAVDFALAVMTRELGLPRGSATLIFALGRTVGWLAHIAEQQASPAPIRPRARYVGP
ncbi:MAG: citrate/2-methylcitrate synthase [Myxococcota bacterium]